MRRQKRAAVDTNLLLLAMCASLRRDPCKDGRLSRYQAIDIALIQQVLESFDSLVTTPNLIAEVNTMIKGYEEYQWLKDLLANSCEVYLPNQPISHHEALPVFGITDLGFLSRGPWRAREGEARAGGALVSNPPRRCCSPRYIDPGEFLRKRECGRLTA
jgi:hypothetical protein